MGFFSQDSAGILYARAVYVFFFCEGEQHFQGRL